MSAPESYALPAKLDLLSAASLAEGFDARRGKPLVLDAKEVTHIGTPGLQVVISARKTWEEDGLPLTLENFSEALEAQLKPLGLTPSDLAASNSATTDHAADAEENAEADAPETPDVDEPAAVEAAVAEAAPEVDASAEPLESPDAAAESADIPEPSLPSPDTPDREED